MKQTRAIVITGNGTNCEMEAAHACRLGGFDDVVIAHISEILSGEIRLDDFHFLNLTGGFLDGDDLGSAKAQANRLKYASVAGSCEKLVDQFIRFIADGKHCSHNTQRNQDYRIAINDWPDCVVPKQGK